jgi:hypothetical protein
MALYIKQQQLGQTGLVCSRLCSCRQGTLLACTSKDVITTCPTASVNTEPIVAYPDLHKVMRRLLVNGLIILKHMGRQWAAPRQSINQNARPAMSKT